MNSKYSKRLAILFITQYFGQGKHIIAFPIVSPDSTTETLDAVNIVAFSSKPELEGTKYDGPWMRPVAQSSLLHEFYGWEPELQALLEVSVEESKSAALLH